MLSSLFTTAVLLAVTSVHAFPDAWSFGCAPETTQRSDPLISPGKPSGHTHVIVGGNAFSRSMSAPRAATDATATSCDAVLDHSNYWVPALYHIGADGKFELVKFTGTGFYYQNRACNFGTTCKQYEVPPTAFPEGFRMIAGDALRRTFNRTDPWQAAISMNCGGIDYYDQFPPVGCKQLRAQITFPSCWDGKNVQSANHQSHVAYPTNYNGGVCPQSHPIALPSIFSEWYFDIYKYNDNNFVFANGDTTTNGFHGDFVNGWTDLGALQRSFQECLSADNCPIRLTGKPENVQKPRPLLTPAVFEEDLGINGTFLDTLPGGNPVFVRPTTLTTRKNEGRKSYKKRGNTP